VSSITAPDASTRTRTRTRSQLAASIGLWAAQVLLGLAFASGGWLKLSGDPAMAGLFDTIGAGTIGAGQWLRFFVGAVEIAGGLGLLIPALSGLAARGLITLLAGAAITNVALGVARSSPRSTWSSPG
jgi:putative oxidoreductase